MIIGFTGTRDGMTVHQHRAVRALLEEYAPDTARHGDCVGADADFHTAVRLYAKGCRIVVHPPASGALRARCVGDETTDPRPYLARNADIVEGCDLLLACPAGPEKVRSGTWSTIRLARKLKKPVVVVYPDGRLER